MDWFFGAVAFVFLSTLIGLVYLRTRKKGIEVRPGDIAAALLPAFLILMVDGRVKNLQWGDLKVELAVQDASKQPIDKKVVSLPVETLQLDEKTSMEVPEELRRKNPTGLTFVVGENRYVGAGILNYLQGLPTLRFLVFVRPDHAFVALADAKRVLAELTARRPSIDAGGLAEAVNRGRPDDLALLPGHIPAAVAAKETDAIGPVLGHMNELDLDVLPVTREDGSFVGVVSRTRLTASMLIDIARRLE